MRIEEEGWIEEEKGIIDIDRGRKGDNRHR